MAMRKIMYLVNPISGTAKKDLLLAKIEKQTKAKGIPYAIAHTVADGDYAMHKERIEEEGFTDIVIIGGDGTVNGVVNSLRHVQGIRFGIIPLGSGNGLAFAAGIPRPAYLHPAKHR